MLINSPRIRTEDRATWERLLEFDRILGRTDRMRSLEHKAREALKSFLAHGDAYASVSWGKDSVVVAHLTWTVSQRTPLVWFPAGAIENPECAAVRDAFLSRYPAPYREIPAPPEADITEAFYGHDGAQKEFEKASASLGQRYISGVRAAESRTRKIRMRTWGESSPNTCAPIGWWPTEFVFAYLERYDLPIHPQYAMSLGGMFDRAHIRVGTLGGYRGENWGRREHEKEYYPEEMKRLGIWR